MGGVKIADDFTPPKDSDQHDDTGATGRHQPDDRGHAADAPRVHPHGLQTVVLDEPCEPIAERMRTRQLKRRILIQVCLNLRRDELTERRQRDEALGPDAPTVEHETHPFGHIRYARPHRSCRRHRIDAVRAEAWPRPVAAIVSGGNLDARLRARLLLESVA